MLTIVAKLQAAPGKEQELRAAAEKMVAAVKENEKGRTVTYSLHVSPDDPATLLFYETYADDDAATNHRSTQHMGAFNAAIRDGSLLAGRPTIERYTKIAGVE
jgi:quinol monooxygenase YgiN